MKKLILLLFPVVFFAQSNFQKLDSLGFKNQVENIIKTTGKQYNFYKYKNADGTKILAYKNTTNQDDKLAFFYSTNNDNWTLKSITGNFNSVFAVWQNIADPKANAETIKSKGSYLTKGTPSYSINQLEPDYWMMRF